ncbi:MAG: hypothetical protein IKZ39_02565, partial [Lachnospiraceae bacterium]|nr:hypothetical protein [Lachnospiraceae bacterium]
MLYSQKGQFMSVNGKNQEITKEDIVSVGRKFCIKNPGDIIERTLDIVSHIDRYLSVLNIDLKVRNMVAGELNGKYSEFVNKSSVLIKENVSDRKVLTSAQVNAIATYEKFKDAGHKPLDKANVILKK